MTPYRFDLQRCIPAFRGPLDRFAQKGTMPADRTLLAVVLGQYREAIKMVGDGPNTLAGVIIFLERNVPGFAWGSPENAARWEHMKKQIARADRDVITAIVPLLALVA